MNVVKLIKFIFFNCVICMIFMVGCGKPDIGIRNGKLLPCPSMPNCVFSDANDASHHVDPLIYSGSRENAMKAVLLVLESMPGAKVVQEKNDYIHAEFTSKIFHFVDDVEFFFPEDTSVIHVRSASRVGYYDHGANKKHMKEIHKLFNEKMGVNVTQ